MLSVRLRKIQDCVQNVLTDSTLSRTTVLFGSHQQATCFWGKFKKKKKKKKKQKNTKQEHKSPKTWNRMKIWTGCDPRCDHDGEVLD